MTIEQKNLLLFFLEKSKNDKGCTIQKMKVLSLLSKLKIELGVKEGTKDNKIFVNLENEVLTLFEMTSKNYFEFGLVANDVVENYQLSWNKEVIDEK